MKFLGFDPGAHVTIGDSEALAEVTLHRQDDGRYVLRSENDDGRSLTVSLRPDFLDELVTQARTREAAA